MPAWSQTRKLLREANVRGQFQPNASYKEFYWRPAGSIQFSARQWVLVAARTDGAIDAQSPDGSRFSTEGLAGSLFGRYESATSIVDAVRTAVDDFRRGRDLADDLTVVAIRLQSQLTAPRRSQAAAALAS